MKSCDIAIYLSLLKRSYKESKDLVHGCFKGRGFMRLVEMHGTCPHWFRTQHLEQIRCVHRISLSRKFAQCIHTNDNLHTYNNIACCVPDIFVGKTAKNRASKELQIMLSISVVY